MVEQSPITHYIDVNLECSIEPPGSTPEARATIVNKILFESFGLDDSPHCSGSWSEDGSSLEMQFTKYVFDHETIESAREGLIGYIAAGAKRDAEREWNIGEPVVRTHAN